MHSQTLQALRGEIEAVTTLQLALNRVALFVEDDSLSVWDGPRPEDVDDVAADDGSFLREAVFELRTKAGDAIARRYKEVDRIIQGKPALEAVVRSILSTGTGGVISADATSPGEMLGKLARSGSLKLDWAQEAAAQVREVLDIKVKVKAPLKKKAAKVKPAARKKQKAAPAKKKTLASSKAKKNTTVKKKPAAKKKKK